MKVNMELIRPLLAIGAALGFVIGFLVCSKSIGSIELIDGGELILIQFASLFFCLTWFTIVTIGINSVRHFQIVMIVTSPTALMTMGNTTFLLIALLMWVLSTISFIFYEADDSPKHQGLLVVVITWSVTETFMLVNTKVFDHAGHILNLLQDPALIFLRFRWLSAIVFLSIIGTVSVARAFKEGTPGIPPIAHLRLRYQEWNLPPFGQAILLPFLILLDGLLLAVTFGLDVIWRSLATLFVYLIRLGRQAGKVLWEVLQEGAVVRTLARLLGLFCLLLAMSTICVKLAPKFWAYLQASTFESEISLISQITIAAFVIMMLTALICPLMETKIIYVFFGFSTIMAMLLIAGLSLSGVAQFEISGFECYRRLGIFSRTLLLIIFLGGITLFIKNITDSK